MNPSSPTRPDPGRPTVVRVLDHDPDLGAALEGAREQAARRELVAPVIEAPPGPWDGEEMNPRGPLGHFGLLLIEGVLARNLVVHRRTCTELLGPGDLLRPWVAAVLDESIRIDAAWMVVEPTRFAVLDHRFVLAVSRFPEVTAALMDRLVLRSRWLGFHLAICHLPKVEDRLMLTLWHLADRWGRVTRDGVVIRVPLKHHVLAAIVGARRPSVTTALGALQKREVLERTAQGGWLLHGEPPSALAEMNGQLTGVPSDELLEPGEEIGV